MAAAAAGGVTLLAATMVLMSPRIAEANASKEHVLGFTLAVILLVGGVG